MDPVLERLKQYLKNTPRETIERDWNALSKYANVGPSIPDFFASFIKDPTEWCYEMRENNNNVNTIIVTETPKYNSEFFYLCKK